MHGDPPWVPAVLARLMPAWLHYRWCRRCPWSGLSLMPRASDSARDGAPVNYGFRILTPDGTSDPARAGLRRRRTRRPGRGA